jgi:hypothetical protein
MYQQTFQESEVAPTLLDHTCIHSTMMKPSFPIAYFLSCPFIDKGKAIPVTGRGDL